VLDLIRAHAGHHTLNVAAENPHLRAAPEPAKTATVVMSTTEAPSSASASASSLSGQDQPDQRLHLVLYGQVQGVGYRASAAREAKALGLRGWVRNLSNGSVELCVEGATHLLEQLAAWCRQGPPAARVESLDVLFSAATGEFQDFQIRRDKK